METTKNMLLRLDPVLAEELQVVATVEGRSVSDVAREAIHALVEQRRTDKKFQRALQRSLEEHAKVLGQLRQERP